MTPGAAPRDSRRPVVTPGAGRPAGDGTGPAAAGRWELLRALGALSAAAPAAAGALFGALGLQPWDGAEHTEVFVLELPPYASIHLGPEGKLGGDAADRVAGVWRTLGLDPPPDPDHLHALLGLYAELGEAAGSCRTDTARRRLDHTRTAVLWEHLWPWLPGYLDAVAVHHPAADPWARLLGQALEREAAASPGARALALALRAAPDPIGPDDSPDQLLDAATAPVRTGFILTAADLSRAAGASGVGLRRGERRFALKAMLEQNTAATLGWLAAHAAGWARRHRQHLPVAFDPAPWWAGRAAHSAAVLTQLAHRASRAA